MIQKIIKVNFLILFLATFSWGEIVTDIQVDGNKRISKDTLILFSEVAKVSDYTQEDLNEALKKIYNSNFFKTVNLTLENSILNITVVENPIISGVEINGIKSTKLLDFINEKLSLKNRSSFIESKFKNDLVYLNNILKSQGFYFATIDTNSIINKEQTNLL